MIQESEVLNALRVVIDPDLNQDIVTLGFVQNLSIADGVVTFDLRLTTPACPVKDDLKKQCSEAVAALNGVNDVQVNLTSEVKSHQTESGKKIIKGVKNIIAVGSGKGGVGKSTITVNLASSFASQGARVGLLDADIYGPSIPMMMGSADKLKTNGEKIMPVTSHGVTIMSMGYMAQGDDPLIWRGPMAHKALHQCLFDVNWGDLDYLFVDLPPGTGDIHLTLGQEVELAGAVIVSTPQDVGLTISRKTMRMFEKIGIRILGFVENMSGHICTQCGHEEDVFGKGAVENSASELGIPFLGAIPLHQDIRIAGDQGIPPSLTSHNEVIRLAYRNLMGKLAQQISAAHYESTTV